MSASAFRPNGCSLSPDGSWRHCCDLHDLVYYVGGSLIRKIRGDVELGWCIAKGAADRKRSWWRRIAAPFVGTTYTAAVSVFGLLPWHWRYGRPRRVPTRRELEQLDRLTDEQLDRLEAMRGNRSPMLAAASIRRRARARRGPRAA